MQRPHLVGRVRLWRDLGAFERCEDYIKVLHRCKTASRHLLVRGMHYAVEGRFDREAISECFPSNERSRHRARLCRKGTNKLSLHRQIQYQPSINYAFGLSQLIILLMMRSWTKEQAAPPPATGPRIAPAPVTLLLELPRVYLFRVAATTS